MIYDFIMLIKTVLVIITIIKTPCHARTIILINVLIVVMLRKIRSNEDNTTFTITIIRIVIIIIIWWGLGFRV